MEHREILIKKPSKKIFVILFVMFTLAGCASKPVLNQVSDGAQESSINSPQKALELIQKYSK